LYLEIFGQFGLRHALLPLQTHQRTPLGSRHAVLPRALVDVGSHRASHLGELEQDFPPRVRWSLHELIISLLTIWRYWGSRQGCHAARQAVAFPS
jgi:hypothetical protein